MSNVQQKNGTNRWVVLLVLVLSFTITFFNRFIWSPILTDASQELNFTMQSAGAYMSAFYFGYLITQIPAGILADRFRVKYILFTCVLIGGLLTFSMSLIHSYGTGLFIRALTGLVGGFIMACCSRLLSNYFQAKERATAFGFLMAAPPLGTLFANLVGPPANAAFGWRATFQIASLGSVLVCLLIFFIIQEPQTATTAKKGAKVGMLEGIKVYLTNKQILILSLAGFLFMWVPPGTSIWGNSYIKSIGYSGSQAGLVLTLYSIASIFGSISAGYIGDKFKISKKLFIQVAYALMAIFAFLFGMQKSISGLIFVGMIFGYVSYLSSTHITTLAISYAGDRYAATTTSLQNLIFQIANVFMPIVCGSILDKTGSFSGIWYLFTGLMIAALVTISFAKKDNRRNETA